MSSSNAQIVITPRRTSERMSCDDLQNLTLYSYPLPVSLEEPSGSSLLSIPGTSALRGQSVSIWVDACQSPLGAIGFIRAEALQPSMSHFSSEESGLLLPYLLALHAALAVVLLPQIRHKAVSALTWVAPQAYGSFAPTPRYGGNILLMPPPLDESGEPVIPSPYIKMRTTSFVFLILYLASMSLHLLMVRYNGFGLPLLSTFGCMVESWLFLSMVLDKSVCGVLADTFAKRWIAGASEGVVVEADIKKGKALVDWLEHSSICVALCIGSIFLMGIKVAAVSFGGVPSLPAMLFEPCVSSGFVWLCVSVIFKAVVSKIWWDGCGRERVIQRWFRMGRKDKVGWRDYAVGGLVADWIIGGWADTYFYCMICMIPDLPSWFGEGSYPRLSLWGSLWVLCCFLACLWREVEVHDWLTRLEYLRRVTERRRARLGEMAHAAYRMRPEPSTTAGGDAANNGANDGDMTDVATEWDAMSSSQYAGGTPLVQRSGQRSYF